MEQDLLIPAGTFVEFEWHSFDSDGELDDFPGWFSGDEPRENVAAFSASPPDSVTQALNATGPDGQPPEKR